MNTYTTLYLADDHQIVIDGLKLLIGNEDTIKIVGYANDGETAYNDIKERKPDIALIDLSMPKLNGLELIFMLRKVVPDTRFIILSMHDNLRNMQAAKNGGASGYILKNVGKTELMKCLNLVREGNTYFPNLKTKPAQQNKSLFTPREIEIVRLILEGCSSSDIADQLHVSPGTIDTHRKNINRKTGTSTPLGLNKFLQENQIKL